MTRAKLKWRKVKGEWRAGPLKVGLRGGVWMTVAPKWFITTSENPENVKRSCEQLAQTILRAMK